MNIELTEDARAQAIDSIERWFEIAQQRLLARVAEPDIECHADEFGFWRKPARGR